MFRLIIVCLLVVATRLNIIDPYLLSRVDDMMTGDVDLDDDQFLFTTKRCYSTEIPQKCPNRNSNSIPDFQMIQGGILPLETGM